MVSPDGSRVYAVNAQDITVIDTATGTAAATIGVDGGFLELSPDGSRTYVTQSSGFLSVIDTATNSQVVAIPIGNGLISGATITPDGRAVYIVQSDDESGTYVSIVDTASNSVVGTVPIPADPADPGARLMTATAAPDSATVWVGESLGVLSIIDTTARTVVATIDGVEMNTVNSIVFSGTRAYAPTAGITVVDVPSRTKLGHFEYEGYLNALAAAPSGRFLYLAVGGYGEIPMVRVLDAATTFVVGEIPLGATPRALAVASDGRTLFVTTEANDVVVVDTTPYS